MGPLIIWRFSDGRRGHDAQSLGLTRALGRLIPCRTFDLPALPWPKALWYRLRKRFPPGLDLPDPDLIVGAGHGTHLCLLAARSARMGMTVVLMHPTFPARWFDFCIVPEHDPAPPGDRILRSCGPLNSLDAAGRNDNSTGLILVGGPSRHFHWDFDDLLPRIRELLRPPGIRWTLSDSPRTPPGDSAVLARLPDIAYHAHQRAGPDWLAGQLAAAGPVWVTADSLSMIFEALSAGPAVGMLELPPRRLDRVTRTVSDLVARGMVTPFEAWRAGAPLRAIRPVLREADRCASLLLQRLGAMAG